MDNYYTKQLLFKRSAIYKIIYTMPLIIFILALVLFFDDAMDEFIVDPSITIYDAISMILMPIVIISFAYIAIYQIIMLKIDGGKLYIYQIGRWKSIDISSINKYETKGMDVYIYIQGINTFNYVKVICKDYIEQKALLDFLDNKKATFQMQ